MQDIYFLDTDSAGLNKSDMSGSNIDLAAITEQDRESDISQLSKFKVR